MFVLTYCPDSPRAPWKVVEKFATFEAAEMGAKARLQVAYYARDPVHVGCADLITHSGDIYTIEARA